MKTKRRNAYWLAMVLAVAFATAYAHNRDLPARYEQYVERQREVESTRQNRSALLDERDRQAQRAEKLGTDPLEIESAIRERRQHVRPGEILFRIEEVPDRAPAAEPQDTTGN